MNSKMNFSELNEVIEIQRSEEIVNDYGGTENTFVTISKPRTKVKYISTKEYISANSDTVSFIIKFIIRKRDINHDDFVLYKNERYDIEHVYPFEDRMYIELTCKKVV